MNDTRASALRPLVEFVRLAAIVVPSATTFFVDIAPAEDPGWSKGFAVIFSAIGFALAFGYARRASQPSLWVALALAVGTVILATVYFYMTGAGASGVTVFLLFTLTIALATTAISVGVMVGVRNI